jgi:hypothetical protein
MLVYGFIGTCLNSIEGVCSWNSNVSLLPRPSSFHHSQLKWTTPNPIRLSAQSKESDKDYDEIGHGSAERDPLQTEDINEEDVDDDDQIANTKDSTTPRQQSCAKSVTTVNPAALFQKAVDKYWEEFQKSGAGSSGSSLSIPSPSQWMQLLNLLAEFSTDPTQPLTFLESWREAQTDGERKNTITWTNTDPKNHSGNVISKVGNKTNVEAWRDSWNKSLTTDDVREMGDHIWRYLIGGELTYCLLKMVFKCACSCSC